MNSIIIVRTQAHIRGENCLTQTDFYKHLFDLVCSGRSADFALYYTAEWFFQNAPEKWAAAADYLEALESIYQGGMSPKELGEAVRSSDRVEPFTQKTLSQLIELDQFLASKQVCLTSKGLGEFLSLLRAKKVPFCFLNEAEVIYAHHLVALNPLELDILVELAEQGWLVCLNWPLDEASRGITLPINYLAQRIEKKGELEHLQVKFSPLWDKTGPLHNFLDTLFTPYRCEESSSQVVKTAVSSSQYGEVEELIQQLSVLNGRIVIALRTLDKKADWLKMRLERAGFKVRLEAGEWKRKKLAHQWVLNLLYARLEGKSGIWIETVKHHPLFASQKKEVEALLTSIPLEASLSEYMGIFDLETPFSSKQTSEKVSLRKFIHFLEHVYWSGREKETFQVREDDAILIKPLSELGGLSYDYVLMPFMVQGEVPLRSKASLLLTDKERLQINLACKKGVMRIFEEDPLEDWLVAPKIAYEPLYFMEACAAAEKGLFLYASHKDMKGKELVISEFFRAAQAALMPSQIERKNTESWALGPEKKVVLKEEKPDLALLLKRRFPSSLGLSSQYPLTATRLEAYATCHYKAFVEKMLKVNTEEASGSEVDARLLGQLAHEVLEKYYSHIATTDFGAEERSFLSEILFQTATQYENQVGAGHPNLFVIQVEFLKEALARVINNLSKHPFSQEMKPSRFELKIGFDETRAGVPIWVLGEQRYFGGIVDRVDEGKTSRIIIDYKLSSSVQLQQKLKEDALGKTQFQLLLYGRLLEAAYPTEPSSHLGACLVSIREGSVSKILGFEKVLDYKARALDDEREDGLVKGIEQVLSPFIAGTLPIHPGTHCRFCRLGPVCRVGELKEQEEEGEDV